MANYAESIDRRVPPTTTPRAAPNPAAVSEPNPNQLELPFERGLSRPPAAPELSPAGGRALLPAVKTLVKIGTSVVVGWIAGKVGNAILWSGSENVPEKQKDATAVLFGGVPGGAIPAAILARVMADVVFGPVVKSFYYGNYQKQREENSQLTDKEFDRIWDEQYDKSGYAIPWNLLPENQ